jgi:hypothetical protein
MHGSFRTASAAAAATASFVPLAVAVHRGALRFEMFPLLGLVRVRFRRGLAGRTNRPFAASADLDRSLRGRVFERHTRLFLFKDFIIAHRD